ncbi:MAG TPA: fasciclin domain-containing protein [Methanothrix sp.]|nr:fasciclin domain-containing protein [Methanothrix sp.]
MVNETEPVVNETEPVVSEPELMSIFDTAAADGQVETLVMALEAAGLADLLRFDGPFTVFAPPEDVIASAMADVDMNDTEAVAGILEYHIAIGNFTAADIRNMTTITTLQGGELTVEVTDEGIKVGGANVIEADIICSNGVIHIIDAVLMPPAEEEVASEEAPAEEMPPAEIPVEEAPAEEESPAEEPPAGEIE